MIDRVGRFKLGVVNMKFFSTNSGCPENFSWMVREKLDEALFPMCHEILGDEGTAVGFSPLLSLLMGW